MDQRRQLIIGSESRTEFCRPGWVNDSIAGCIRKGAFTKTVLTDIKSSDTGHRNLKDLQLSAAPPRSFHLFGSVHGQLQVLQVPMTGITRLDICQYRLGEGTFANAAGDRIIDPAWATELSAGLRAYDQLATLVHLLSPGIVAERTS
ncbi:hypothetical protein BGZ83_010920 [Gryganskiella cystojenkinii]|nr:hypothetical protein BGZ83_010920 [Gryganskiella cystojenkinii]